MSNLLPAAPVTRSKNRPSLVDVVVPALTIDAELATEEAADAVAVCVMEKSALAGWTRNRQKEG